jgi:hypothetical protein
MRWKPAPSWSHATRDRENLVRSDGHPVGIHPLDATHHIYRYDTVMEGKDISLAMQFTLDNRRVFKDIALLSGRDAQLDEVLQKLRLSV